MSKEESSTVKRMRRELSREYGCKIYEDDFNLAVRVPLESIEDLNEKHLDSVRRALDRFDRRTIEEKVVSTFLVADEDNVDLEVELLFEALREDDPKTISDQLVTGESEKRTAINERVRKIMEKISEERKKEPGSRGKVVDSRGARGDFNLSDISVTSSIRKAIGRGSFERGGRPKVKKDHLQEKIYQPRLRTNICLIADTSFYPDMREEISTMKWIIRIILTLSYENRYHVSIISFSNNSAVLEMPFTTDVDKGYEVVENFDYGGLSPLSSGLRTGMRVLERQRGDSEDVVSILVLLTKGKANVPLYPGGFVRRELDYFADVLEASHIKSVIIHIGQEEKHRMKEISFKSQSRYYNPPLLKGNLFID